MITGFNYTGILVRSITLTLPSFKSFNKTILSFLSVVLKTKVIFLTLAKPSIIVYLGILPFKVKSVTVANFKHYTKTGFAAAADWNSF